MRKIRPGYTLMEVVLVCVVLVVASAVAVPVVRSMFSGSSIDAAKDAVREGLAEARNAAIEQSRPYRFEVMNQTGNYRIAPDDEIDSLNADLVTENLPDGVVFCCTTDAGTGSWSTIAIFRPDGTADRDAEIGIRTENIEPIYLRLRASTGSVASTADAGTPNPL